MANTTNDTYIIKLKGLGWTHANIAKKLGMREADVDARWKDIEAAYITGQASGYAAFCDHYTIMCHQYQLLGESLKITAGFLGSRMLDSELDKLIVEDWAQTLKNLKDFCVVLRPFVPITPAESAQKALQGN